MVTSPLEVLTVNYWEVVEAEIRWPTAHRSLIVFSKAGASKNCSANHSFCAFMRIVARQSSLIKSDGQIQRPHSTASWRQYPGYWSSFRGTVKTLKAYAHRGFTPPLIGTPPIVHMSHEEPEPSLVLRGHSDEFYSRSAVAGPPHDAEIHTHRTFLIEMNAELNRLTRL
jgi:hypothetical protein